MPPSRRKLAAVPAPVPGDLERAVVESIGHLELRPEDAGIRELALKLARTIDRAAELAAEAAAMPYDPDTAALVARLRVKVDAHTVAADVSPKLLAALDALGATPKARAHAPKAAGKPAGSALAQLRGGA